MDQFFSPELHTDFLIVYSTSWNPDKQFVTTVHTPRAVSLDHAIRETAKATTAAQGRNRWVVCDDGTLIRADDVRAVQVVPATSVAQPDEPQRQPFGFTLPGK